MKKSSFAQKIMNAPYIIWSVLFIIAPLIMVIYYAFTDAEGNATLNNIAQIGKANMPIALKSRRWYIKELHCQNVLL